MWVQKIGGGGVTALAYAPDGRTLYTLDAGGWLTAWDVATHAYKRLFQLRPNERYYGRELFLIGDRYLVVTVPATARVWDTVGGAELPDLPVGLRYGSLRPLRGRSAVQFVGTDQRGLDMCDVTTGAVTRLFTAPEGLSQLIVGDVGIDGSAVVYDNFRRALRMWPDGTVSELTPPFDGSPRFSLDDRHLLWMNAQNVQVWDADTLAVRCEAKCYSPYSLFALSPTAPVFVARNPDRQLTLFNLDGGAALRSLDFALGKYVMCAAFSPDGLTCAVGGTNKQFAVFDVDV